jgi:hypothetical protein
MLKLENGQILKIMPIIRKDGSHCFFIPVSCIFVDNKVIYDEGDFLNKLYNSYRDPIMMNPVRVNYSKKYLLSVWHDNQLKMISVGKSIHDIIIEELSKGSYDFRNNKHLEVVSLEVKTGFGQSFPDYKSSNFIDLDWEKPVESREEWIEFIKNNQFEFDEFLKVKGVMYNLTFLNSKYDNFFSFLISDMRNKKLKELGI